MLLEYAPLNGKKVNSTKRYTNTTEYFNPGAIKRMDELVNLTDSLHLYFMPTMDWHGHLMEGGGWENSPYNVINGNGQNAYRVFYPAQRPR